MESEELSACLFYEYARESRSLRKEVASLKEKMAQSPNKQVMVTGLGGTGGQTLVIYLSLVSGFPNTAWTELKAKDKKMWGKFLKGIPHLLSYVSTVNNPPLTLSKNTPEKQSLEEWIKMRKTSLPQIPESDAIKYGFYAINMNYPKIILMQEFYKMLHSFEGKPVSETPPLEELIVMPKKSAGRKSERDLLKALGALRLRYYYRDFMGAQQMMKRPLNKEPLRVFYSHRESFYRACASAVRHFKNLFGWFDPNPPMHFKRSSRNQN